MKQFIRFLIFYSLIVLLTLGLYATFRATERLRELQVKEKQLQVLQGVLPPFDNDPLRDIVRVPWEPPALSGRRPGGEKTVLIAKRGDTIVGFAFAAGGLGYNGRVNLMIGVDPEAKLTGFSILRHEETLGLGSHAQESSFRAQYVGRGAEELFLVREDGPIEALTGATVTTKAINQILREALERFKSTAFPLLQRGTQGDLGSTQNPPFILPFTKGGRGHLGSKGDTRGI